MMRKLLLTIFILFIGAGLASAIGHWEELTTDYPTGKKLNGVNFLNETFGFAVGNDFNIWKTTDRGLNWSAVVSESVDTHLNAVQFATETKGYAVAEDADGWGGAKGGIFKTSDGGSNWPASVTANYFICKNLHCLGENTVWVAGYVEDVSGTIWKTTSSGSSWSTIQSDFANLDELHDVYFSNANNGCTVGKAEAGEGKIWYSDDGGNSWHAAETPSSLGTLRAVCGVGTTAWAVGDAGTVLKSVGEAFAGWAKITEGIDPDDLYDVYFLNEEEGWIVGSGGAIYYSNTGGNAWRKLETETVPTTEDLRAIQFVDEYNGWIVGGSSNVILKYVVNPEFLPDIVEKYQGWSGNIVLTGINFQPGVVVDIFKGGGGSGFTYTATRDSETQITITATIASDATIGGDWNIWVINPDTGWWGCGFTVNPLPAITKVIPETAVQGQTLDIAILGSGFQTGLTTVFSPEGITINSMNVNGDSSLSANISVAPAAPTGGRVITITNPDGGIVTEEGLFSITPFGVDPPIITSVSPESGAQGQTLDIDITGSNFHNTTTIPEVEIGNGDVTVNSVTFINDGWLKANISIDTAAITKPRTVTVRNMDDGGIDVWSPFYVVKAGGVTNPAVSSISPDEGYVGSKNLIIYVTGDHFQSKAEAFFNNPLAIIVNDVTPESSGKVLKIDTTISSTATPGPYDLTILNPDGGSVTERNGFEVLATTPKAKVRDKSSDKPIGQPYPSPWNPIKDGPVNLQFELTNDDLIKLIVWDSNGKWLQEFLVNAIKGKNKISWDGITFTGDFPPNGMLVITINSMTQNKVLGTIKLVVTNKK